MRHALILAAFMLSACATTKPCNPETEYHKNGRCALRSALNSPKHRRSQRLSLAAPSPKTDLEERIDQLEEDQFYLQMDLDEYEITHTQ